MGEINQLTIYLRSRTHPPSRTPNRSTAPFYLWSKVKGRSPKPVFFYKFLALRKSRRVGVHSTSSNKKSSLKQRKADTQKKTLNIKNVIIEISTTWQFCDCALFGMVSENVTRTQRWIVTNPTFGDQVGSRSLNHLVLVGFQNQHLVGGWTNPSEKYARQIVWFPQIGVKIKHI